MNSGLTTSHLYVSDGATFSGSTLAFQGTNAKTITTTQAPLTIKGVTSGGVVAGYNAIVLGVQQTDPLQLYSASGVVDIKFNPDAEIASSTSIKLNTNDGDLFTPIVGSVTIQPSTFFTADRTINIPDASGTLALTGANTFSGLQTMNAGLTTSHLYVTNGATFAGTSVHTGLGIFNGGITSNHLYVTNGATFAARASFNSGLSSANLFVSGGGTFGTSVSISGGTAWHSLNDGKGSGLDADFLRGINGDRYLEEIQTGLLYGGVLSINGTTGFNVSAGAGIVVTVNASLTGFPNPTLTNVAWNSFTGQSVLGLTSGDFTFVRIDSSGNLQQSTSDFTQTEYLNSVVLGNLVHPSRSTLDRVHSHPIVAYASSAQYEAFIRYFGPLKVSGYAMSGFGTTGQVQVSSGVAFALGANMITDPNNPSVVTDSASVPLSTFYYLYRNADGSYKTNPTTSTTVSFNNYDDGDGTLGTISTNNWSIQRVYKIPGSSVVYVYYGRNSYSTSTTATAAILTESFDEADITLKNGVFLGWLIVRGGGSNVTSTGDCVIIPGGFFRNTTGGGGAATVSSLDDLSDVTITSPSSNQILRYDGTQGLWVNSAVTTLPLVTSINGITGAIGITAGSNITITQSGLTFTISSSTPPLASATVTGVASFGNEFTVSAAGAVGLTSNYVKSVNGLTGAVVSIATTGSNTFTGLQTMNAGLTTSHLYVSGGATFTGNVTISGFTQGVEFKADSALITFGDINSEGNGSKLTIDDSANIVQIENAQFLVGDGATFSNKVEFNNNIDMKWTGHGGSTQVVTASGSAGLRISHAFGKQIQIGNAGLDSRNTYISVTEDTAGDNDTGKIEFGWTRTDNPEGDPVVYETGNFVFPQSSGVTGNVLRVKSHDGNNSILEWGDVSGVSSGGSSPPPLASASVTGVASFGNEFTVSAAGAVGLTSNYVKSVNGLTGTVVGIATTGSNVFTGLQTMNAGLTANNIYVTNGATFASAIQGTAASFTGLVSSTVGFSGSATNLVGNANGLTAGTASRVQIAEGAGSSYYLALVGGTGNTGIFVDTSVPRWNYNASTGALVTTTGYVEAANLYATTAIYANTLEGFDGTSPLNIVAPYFDGTNQPMYIGDTNGSQNGTLITIDDAASKIEFFATNINALGSLNVKNSGYLVFYDADVSNYIAFRGPTALAANTTWTLPSADGSANQVLTTNGSGTLSWSTPSGGSGGGGSSVTSFNGLTGAVTGVSRVNGLTGGLTFAAGTGITFTTSGNTITIASAPKSTTQTLDFSEDINGVEIVFYGTGGDLGSSLQNVENNKIIKAIIGSDGTDFNSVLDSIKSFYDPTNGWSARLIAKAPFTAVNDPNDIRTIENIRENGINQVTLDLTTASGFNTVDFWTTLQSHTVYHQDATYVVKTVTGLTWVAADSYITCKVLGLTTSDHTPEDAILEGVQFEINNIVAGTGFDIIGHAPEGTYGKYTVKCIEQ